MNDYEKNVIKSTSIKQEGGGDSHVHPWKEGVSVTDSLPGGIKIHTTFDSEGIYTGIRGLSD